MQILNEINYYTIITIHQENLLFYFVIWKVLKMKSYEAFQGRNTTTAFLTNSEFSFLSSLKEIQTLFYSLINYVFF